LRPFQAALWGSGGTKAGLRPLAMATNSPQDLPPVPHHDGLDPELGPLATQPPVQTDTLRTESSVEESVIIAALASSSAVVASTMQRVLPRLATHPQRPSLESTPPKSRSPYGRGAGPGVSTLRTRRHWALCRTIRASEPDCLYDYWVDRLVWDIEPCDDDEEIWRASLSPDDALDIVEKARKLVDVSTPPRQPAFASAPTQIVLSPTQPLDEVTHASGADAALAYSPHPVDVPAPQMQFSLAPVTPLELGQCDLVAMAELPVLPRTVTRPPPAQPEKYMEEYRKLYSPQENNEYRAFKDSVRFEPSVDDSDLPMDATLPHDAAAMTDEQKLSAICSPFKPKLSDEEAYQIMGDILCKKGLAFWQLYTLLEQHDRSPNFTLQLFEWIGFARKIRATETIP